MRAFKATDFERDDEFLVSEASYLGFPAGRSLLDFTIEGLGLFVRVKTQVSGGEPDYWIYASADGVLARVYND